MSSFEAADIDVDALTEPLASSLQNIIDQQSLKWIFVGGKGGVGKTSTSSSLAVQLSKHRKSVLLISTDPAHNLSDAFCQKFGKTATLVDGFPNLYAMEIDPSLEAEDSDVLDSGTSTMLAELASSFPGIDEAMSFAELMKQVQTMTYDVIVFDTAPTGHTLRLLSFPSVLEKAYEKFESMKSKFSGLLSVVSGAGAEDRLLGKLEEAKSTVSIIHEQFKSPDTTTFVCVCIPEFLSVYETERLVQELTKYEIDSHNVVVNQVLYPPEEFDPEACPTDPFNVDAIAKKNKGASCASCKKCVARRRMQNKYIEQIKSLYDCFHVVYMPLLDEEVRGVKAIERFSSFLVRDAVAPSAPN